MRAETSASYAYFVENVCVFLESDRRYTCEVLAQELDLSCGTVHLIIRNRLGIQKV